MSDVATCPEGHTYETYKQAGWSDEQLLADPNKAHLIPKSEPQQSNPPPPPVQPSGPPTFGEPIPNQLTNSPQPQLVSDTPPNPVSIQNDTPPTPSDQPFVQNPQNIANPAMVAPVTAQPTNPEVQTSVAAVGAFTPTVGDAITMGQISPANFDSFLKVLSVIKGADNGTIVIRESKVVQSKADCIIQSDMSTVLNFNGKPFDLDIVNPKKMVDLCKNMRNDNDVFVIKDEQSSRYLVTNGEIKLMFPMDASSEQSQISIDTNGASMLNITIDKETRKIIRSLVKDADYTDLLFQDNIMKALYIPDTAVYTFQDYLNDKKAAKLDETNADLILRSTSFLSIDADTYNLNLVKNAMNQYVLVTRSQVGAVVLDVIELLDVTTSGNVMF